MASIKEVAAEARVSLSTVSKVLNNRTDAHISSATRERVRAAAGRIGYHPSAIARGLAGKRMNTIGVVMAYDQESVTSDPYLGPCLDGILSVYKSRGQKVTLFLEGDWNAALDNLPVYGDGHCDGLLLVIPRTNNPVVERLGARAPRLPFVLVGDSRDGDGLICVDMDNIRAAAEATTFLIGQGHRRIAAFGGNYDFCSNDQRLIGYRQALTSAGLPFDPALVFPGEYHVEWGARNVQELLRRFPLSERPTALFCFCDAIAVGALEALKAEGLSVPNEMSVIGIDDIPRAAELGLTTMRQSVRTVGQRAAAALLDNIVGENDRGLRDLIPADLIVRQSVAPPQATRGKEAEIGE
jgi:DNA-binding LacI/PurR family transcriptional regulator